MTIGEKIAKLRKQAGLSQEAFSEKLGISRQAVSKWENGTAQPTNENLAQIARLFDVTISSLLDDEDINMGAHSTFNENPVETKTEFKEVKTERKALAVSSVTQSAAIIVLAIAIIVQGITIGRLKADINRLTQNMGEYTYLQNQINQLQGQIYNFSNSKVPDSDKFTDYNFRILDYDRETNIAALHFSVVPKDYTRDTQAEIVVKGKEKDYSVKAYKENNIFVADTAVYCEDNMTVYLYLTENGKTRSFILDCLENPASGYLMEVQAGIFDGQLTIAENKIMATGNIGCTITSHFNADMSRSIYPVKATIEFYSDRKLVKELPFASIMANDFVRTAKTVLDSQAEETASHEINFYENVDFTVEDKDIVENMDKVGIRVVVVDNNNHEYVSDVKHFEIGGEVKEVITPKAIEIE